MTLRSPFRWLAKLFKEWNTKFLLKSSLNSAKIDLATGCLTIYLSRLSLTKLLISSKVSILVIVDSLIKSKEKKKVSK